MNSGPGLFGKLPETGDFVVRGLPPAQRRVLDRWVTEHLAVRQTGWPKGGLRGLIEADGALVLFLAVASADKVGRRFPLVATTDGAGLSLEEAELWCDRAFETLENAVSGDLGVAEAMAALTMIQPAAREGLDGAPALWVNGGDPQVCDHETVEHLFSSG